MQTTIAALQTDKCLQVTQYMSFLLQVTAGDISVTVDHICQ